MFKCLFAFLTTISKGIRLGNLSSIYTHMNMFKIVEFLTMSGTTDCPKICTGRNRITNGNIDRGKMAVG